MTDMQEPLNGEKPKARNRRERQAQKHAETIGSFSLSQNSQIQNGYVSGTERKPTNCFCLIFFLLYLATCIALSGYGISKGNLSHLVAGVDTMGRFCGEDTAKDYPNFYLKKIDTMDSLVGLCVKECPKTEDSTIDCLPTQFVDATCAITDPANNGYATENVVGLCIPSNIDALGTTLKEPLQNVLSNEYVTRFWKDISITANSIFISLGLGLVYTIIYLYLMSNCAHCLAYMAIALLEVIWLAGIAGCIYAGMHVQANQSPTGAWIGAGSCAAGFLLFNITLCCFWSKLQVAIAVIDATADFMAATKRIVSVTIYYFIIAVIVLLVGGFGVVGTISMNKISLQFDEGSECTMANMGAQTTPCVFNKKIEFTNASIAMLCISCFGLFWILSFIREKTKFIYMISATQYYFTSNRDKEGSSSVCAGMAIANFKHAGSIAFGSFIHTLISVLRAIVDTLVDGAEKNSGNNGVVACIGCLLKCCMGCLESLIEYINLNAYAYMAISGDAYCKSAWNGFMMNLKHLVKFYFADTLAGMFVFMGILTIVALNGGSCYLIMTYGFKNGHLISSIWVPIVLIMVASFIIAELFIGFFAVAVRATLMSLAVDLELNGEPKFGTPSFHQKMDEVLGRNNDAAQPVIGGGYQSHQPGSNQVYTNTGNNQNNQNAMV